MNRTTFVKWSVALAGGFVLLTAAAGCSIIGVAANAMPPKTIEPVYYGLAGNSVGVMVWADRSVNIDFPSIQLDLANSIQSKLKTALKAEPKMKSLAGSTYPVDPRSVVKYQINHPETEAEPITQVAPVVGVKRLIFVEIDDFQTRSDASIELYRGVAAASIKVLAVEGSTAKVAYEDSSIRSTVPKKPVEGVPNSNDYKTYLATIDDLSTQIVCKFIPHPEDEE